MREIESLWRQSLSYPFWTMFWTNKVSIPDGMTEVRVRFRYFCFSVAEWIEAWAIRHVKRTRVSVPSDKRERSVSPAPGSASTAGQTWKMAIRGSEGREGGRALAILALPSPVHFFHEALCIYTRIKVHTVQIREEPERSLSNPSPCSCSCVWTLSFSWKNAALSSREVSGRRAESKQAHAIGPAGAGVTCVSSTLALWTGSEQAGELERDGALVELCERSGEHRSSEHSSERTRPELEARKSQVTREATPQMANALCWNVGDSAHLSYIISHVWRVNIVPVHTCEFV